MLERNGFMPSRTVKPPKGSSLVFAPHPDDETFGLGGSLLNMTANGQEVIIVMMTDGAKGGDAEVRKVELQTATEKLGVKEVFFLNEPDGGLKVTIPNTKSIVDLIEKYDPNNVFFPSPFEYHPDHRATAWLVWDALQSIDFIGNVYSYEIANQSPVNTLIDITPVMKKKIETMDVYASQNAQIDYSDTIIAMNKMRAYTISSEKVKYVEAFFKFPDISMDMITYYYQNFHSYHKGMKTEKLPLVSVLIRTKNRPDRLKHALESVFNQTYQQLEVNIVNDGGVEVQSVVDTFDFERIFVKTHKKSQGRAAAANALLRMIQGEYAVFLDDDDTFDTDHIENLVKVLRENETILAAYSGIRVGEGAKIPSFNRPYKAGLLRRKNFIPFHAVLFSAKLVEDGCKFDESFDVFEDWDFWLQVAEKTELYHFNKITATYNINGQSGAGGAGGHSLNEKDIEYWILKIYDKWLHIWNAEKLHQTYESLATINSDQLEKIKEKLETVTADYNEKLSKKDAIISKYKQTNNHLNNFVDTLLQEKIVEQGTGIERLNDDIKLVSSRHYLKGSIQLYKEVFNEEITKEFWDWSYHNDGMKWRGVCAIKDEKVIGHYNGIAKNIFYFGQHKKALVPSDIMVSPQSRGGFKDKSIFYGMAKTWINKNIGVHKIFLLSYDFQKKKCISVTNRLGLTQEVDTVSELTWNIQDTKLGTKNTFELYSDNEVLNKQIDKLWQRMASGFTDAVMVTRSFSYIKRRYLKHPVNKYLLYVVYTPDKNLHSLIVFKKENKKMLLMDVIARKKDFNLVIADALNIVKVNNCTQMQSWITTSKVNYFDHCNANMKQIDMYISTSCMRDGVDVEELRDKWFLMYGDTDFM